MNAATKLSPFAAAYVACALWSSNDESTPQGGEPFDANYSAADIDPATLETMAWEADAFRDANAADIEAAGLDDSRAGHCFWLNRNGHGSGFWDEKWSLLADAPDECAACDRLSEASERAGSRDLYLGDDGKIYQS